MKVTYPIAVGVQRGVVSARIETVHQLPCIGHPIATAVESAAGAGARDGERVGGDEVSPKIIGEKIQPVRAKNQRHSGLPGAHARPGDWRESGMSFDLDFLYVDPGIAADDGGRRIDHEVLATVRGNGKGD